MGYGVFKSTVEAKSHPQTSPVDWDVSWGQYMVRVRAKYAQEAKRKGCLMLRHKYPMVVTPGSTPVEPIPPLSEMDLHAELTFRGGLTGIQYILEEVANAYCVIPDLLIKKGRKKTVAEARLVAMYLARELTQCSYPEIAEVFNRDHVESLRAHSAIEKRLKVDKELKKKVGEILKVFP